MFFPASKYTFCKFFMCKSKCVKPHVFDWQGEMKFIQILHIVWIKDTRPSFIFLVTWSRCAYAMYAHAHAHMYSTKPWILATKAVLIVTQQCSWKSWFRRICYSLIACAFPGYLHCCLDMLPASVSVTSPVVSAPSKLNWLFTSSPPFPLICMHIIGIPYFCYHWSDYIPTVDSFASAIISVYIIFVIIDNSTFI